MHPSRWLSAGPILLGASPALAQGLSLPEMTAGTGIAIAGAAVAVALLVLAVSLSRALTGLLRDGSRRVEEGLATASRAVLDDAALTRRTRSAEVEALRAAANDGREAIERRIEELIGTVRGRSHEDALILADSLVGELEAIQTALETHCVRLDAHLTERADAGYSKVALRDLLPRVGAPVFTAQAGRIGLLGGSLAGDLAWVHGSFQTWINLDGAAATRQATISLEDAQEAMEAIEDVREGTLHLIRRLLGFLDGRAVPTTARALVEDRVAARAEALSAAEEDGPEAPPEPTPEAVAEGEAIAEGGAAPDAETAAIPEPDPPPAPTGPPPIDDVRMGSPSLPRR
jgi:hypothetical protein